MDTVRLMATPQVQRTVCGRHSLHRVPGALDGPTRCLERLGVRIVRQNFHLGRFTHEESEGLSVGTYCVLGRFVKSFHFLFELVVLRED